jgi:hypothetical protein
MMILLKDYIKGFKFSQKYVGTEIEISNYYYTCRILLLLLLKSRYNKRDLYILVISMLASPFYHGDSLYVELLNAVLI